MKTQSTTKGFAVLSAAGMVVKLLSLLYVPFLLYIIDENGYAVYGAAYTVFVFLYVITNSGMSSAISKIVSELTAFENHRDAVKVFKMARSIMVLVGTLLALIMLILAKPLASFVKYPSAYAAIAALAPAVFLTSIASAYRGYFQGKGYMTPTAVSQIIEQIANLVFSLLFASLWIKKSVEAGIAGATVGTTLGALFSVLYLISEYGKARRSRLAEIKLSKDNAIKEIVRYDSKELFNKLIAYALPLTINWGMQSFGNLIDVQNTKGRLLAGGFKETEANVKSTYFSKYVVLINVPIVLISALCASILPLISGAAAVNNREEVKRGVDYAYKTALLIAIPSAVGLAVLSQPVFNTIFSKYSAGAMLLKYGSVVLIFTAIVQIQATILQGIGKLYLSTIYILIGLLVKLLLNYILIAIPSINILGAVFGSMAGLLIPILLNNVVIKRSLKIKYNLLKLGAKPFAASCFMGVVVYITQFDVEYLMSFIYKGYFNSLISTLAAVAVGIFAYLYALIIIGGITEKDLQSVPRRFRRFVPNTLLKRIRQ